MGENRTITIRKTFGDEENESLSGVWLDLYYSNLDTGIKDLKVKTFVTLYSNTDQLIQDDLMGYIGINPCPSSEFDDFSFNK